MLFLKKHKDFISLQRTSGGNQVISVMKTQKLAAHATNAGAAQHTVSLIPSQSQLERKGLV